MNNYMASTPGVLEHDGTPQLDTLNSKYIGLRKNVQIQQTIILDSAYAHNLPGLAYAYYGDIDMWRVLLMVNGLIDPISDTPPGTIIKMPTLSSVDAYLTGSPTYSEVVI